jgi:hypothetical protein
MSAIIPQDDDLAARHRLSKEFFEKYHEEWKRASWWKKAVIWLRIRREISRAIDHRI